MTICLAVLVAPNGTASLWASDSDLVVGAGAGPAAGNARTDPAGNDLRPAIGWTLLFNGGVDFLHRGSVAAGLEIPVAVHGSRSTDIFAQGSYAGAYSERLTSVVTPGLRVRLSPEDGVSLPGSRLERVWPSSPEPATIINSAAT
jgi:hypothetical protein